ncbi:unnamed protein product [Coregonus sp. 'balchen']|nr:unnamed protein product [Coregonus sp. 'balchen']
MKYTFQSDECMVITIPLGSLRDAQEGQLMPETFHCVFKDVYKVFLKGQPKALGAAQLIAGVLVLILGLLLVQHSPFVLFYTMPSVLAFDGIKWIVAVLLVIELVVAMVVIYWESKAVCRQHFNILPIVTLKQEV